MALLHPKLYFTLFAIFGINSKYVYMWLKIGKISPQN